MPWNAKLRRALAFWGVLWTATPASAQVLGQIEIFLSSAADRRVATFLGPTPAAAVAPGFDYGRFATELVAYLTKEIVPASAEEYRNSPLGSHLSKTMPLERSEFGTHCLEVVARLGSAVPALGSGSPVLPQDSSASALRYAARVGATALALREVWAAALGIDVEEGRRPFSLDPKVGAGRFAVNLTLRW